MLLHLVDTIMAFKGISKDRLHQLAVWFIKINNNY